MIGIHHYNNHGRRKDFFQGGGALGDFSKIFPGGPKVVKFAFSHSKLKKTFFAENFKIQGGPGPLSPPFRRQWQHWMDQNVNGLLLLPLFNTICYNLCFRTTPGCQNLRFFQRLTCTALYTLKAATVQMKIQISVKDFRLHSVVTSQLTADGRSETCRNETNTIWPLGRAKLLETTWNYP